MKIYSGTTLFSIVTRAGIVVGADSKLAGDRNIDSMTKIQRIGYHAVIACAGFSSLHETKTGQPRCRLDKWMREIAQNLPVETDAHVIARIIETAHPLVDIVEQDGDLLWEQLWDFQQPQDHFATFMVASVFLNRFSLLTVNLSVNYEERKIVFTPTTHFDGPAPIGAFKHHGVGRIAEIEKAFSRDGDAYQYMVSDTYGSFERLIEGQEVSLDELRDIVCCAISLEAEANPEHVGPPFVTATLQPGKLVEVVRCRD